MVSALLTRRDGGTPNSPPVACRVPTLAELAGERDEVLPGQRRGHIAQEGQTVGLQCCV